MSATDLVVATGAALLVPGMAEVAGEVVIDSREAGPGSVFVAFAGEKVDGNAYLASALRAGAAAVVATAQPAEADLALAAELGVSVLRAEADDGEEFLLRLAHAWRTRHPEWLVVGVTGSVGKTTTKNMLAAGIASARSTHATAGNHNNLIGLPLTVLSAPEDAEVLVCELGMNHLHEIDRMAAACEPTLAVVTNVGTSHIGLLGSRENIARAKAEVVSGMRAHAGVEPMLALTSANDYSAFIADGYARPAGVDVLWTGTAEADDVRAQGVTVGPDGRASFVASCADGWSREVTLAIPGRKAVDDFLLALAVAWRLGIDRDGACAAIEHMPSQSMRLDVREAPTGARVIDDSYNANPASMASALDVLREMSCEGRRVAVLGEMGELGDEAERLHACVGAYAAACQPDMLVLVGADLAAVMAEAARAMGFSQDAIQAFSTPEEAARVLGPVLAPGDLVLAKASRSSGLDRFVKGVLS